MDLYVPTILILTFSSVMLFVIGITMSAERQLLRQRLDKYSTTGETISAPLHPEFGESFGNRVVMPFLRKVSFVARRMTPAGEIKSVEQKLETAGHPWRMGVAEFLGAQLVCWVVFLALACATYLVLSKGLTLGHGSYRIHLSPAGSLLAWATAIIMAFIGFILPSYLLQYAINERQTKIRKALPDTIDLLTVSVEAGVGLDGAMAKVAEKVKGPLTKEMIRALDEIRMGKQRMQALRDMAERIGLPEVRTFVAALFQAEQLGVSIAKVLRVQGETLRSKRSQMARELASKLPVKMLFPLVLFIFPALFIVLLGPAMIQIYKAFAQ